MQGMTLQQAIDKDYVGRPMVHTNVINGLKTVRYLMIDYTDYGVQYGVWSQSYVLIKEKV